MICPTNARFRVEMSFRKESRIKQLCIWKHGFKKVSKYVLHEYQRSTELLMKSAKIIEILQSHTHCKLIVKDVEEQLCTKSLIIVFCKPL